MIVTLLSDVFIRKTESHKSDQLLVMLCDTKEKGKVPQNRGRKMSDKNDLKRKLLIRSLIGAGCGVIICFCFIFDDGLFEHLMNNKLELFVQILGSAVYGAIPMGGTIVYEIESWGLRRATFTHYCMTFTAFIIASLLLKWFSPSVLIIVLIILTVIYFMIWAFEYFIWKKSIRELNSDLEEFINKEHSGSDEKEDDINE